MIVNQGFTAVRGRARLLYPAVQASPGSKATMVFTITGVSVFEV